MKKILAIIYIALASATLIPAAHASWAPETGSEQTAKEKSQKDEPFSFDIKTYDFGNISENSAPVEQVFKITNNSDSPILIRSAKSSCGCTRPVFTREPIQPGQSGTVKVAFHPRGQAGYVSKDIKVTVVYNGKKTKRTTLRLTGTVTPD